MKLHLTKRSTWDIEKLYLESVEEWGEKVADEYFNGLQETLITIERYPNILRKNPKISNHFMVYPYKRHWIICDKIDDFVFVLTVKFAGMNLASITDEIGPILRAESKELHDLLLKSKGK